MGKFLDSIGLAALCQNIRTYFLRKTEITTGSTNGTISVAGTDVAVNGLSTVATSGSYNDLSDKPTNFVTVDTDQDISSVKTFVGSKTIHFKQSGTNDKLGFTLYTNSNLEKGYLEYNPTNSVNGVPLMTIGNYATSTSGLTYVGFRRYSSISGANGAYNLLTPLISDAKTPFNLTKTYTNFYLMLGVTDGTNVVTTNKSGMLDISSLLPTVPTNISSFTNDSGYLTSVSWNTILNKPTFSTVATSGSYNDLSDKPTIPTVPTNISSFTNDSGYISGVSWGDVSNKPTFSTVATSGSYNDLSDKPTIPTVPTNISSFTNDSGYVTSSYVDNAISDLVGSVPDTLDTLQELSDALGDDPNFATTITNQISTKAPSSSPTFSGVPTAPTATAGTNTTQIATTAFVQNALSNIVPIIISNDTTMPNSVNNNGVWFQLTGNTSITNGESIGY